jgi:hypothetical protein
MPEMLQNRMLIKVHGIQRDQHLEELIDRFYDTYSRLLVKRQQAVERKEGVVGILYLNECIRGTGTPTKKLGEIRMVYLPLTSHWTKSVDRTFYKQYPI